MKIIAIVAATIIATTSAHADTYWYCKGDECVGRSVGPSNPLGHTTIRYRMNWRAICRSQSIPGLTVGLVLGTMDGCGLGNAAQ